MKFKEYITESANINSKDKIIKATVRRYRDVVMKVSIDWVDNKGTHSKVDGRMDSEIVKITLDLLKKYKARIVYERWN